MENLRDRGLTLSARALLVLDGSKALAQGVEKTFGTRALIQRCIHHKERNVLSYLPLRWHAEARSRMRAAWSMTDYSEAKDALARNIHEDSRQKSQAGAFRDFSAIRRPHQPYRVGCGAESP